MNLFNFSSLTEDYEKSLKTYGESPKSLLWWDYRSMAIRFRALVEDLPLDGKSVMDAGCGMGDLLPYIYAKTPNFRYLGLDINKGFIEIAKKRYEGHDFKVADPFSKKIGMYDVVLSSGVMNGNRKGWLAQRKRMIANLYDQTGEVLAFNMAGAIKPPPSDSLIAYAKAQDIFNYCATLTNRLILKTDYLHNDFTIVMYKKI